MLHRTDGIILHTIKYSESSIIAKIYTSEFGLQSYLISGVRTKKSKHKSALLQPLSLVDLIVSNSGKGGLQRITEINLLQPYTEIPYNIVKRSIAIFLNEILYKVLREEHPDADMFEYLKNALLILDLKQESCSNFHIYFMTQLSRYLGFAPQEDLEQEPAFFDLQEGRFLHAIPSHSHYLNEVNSQLFTQFIRTGFEKFHLIKTDRLQRKELLHALILYYKLHITSFGEIKSLSILEEIAA
jgi:DNA repair protein RecO (recombination protein O)